MGRGLVATRRRAWIVVAIFTATVWVATAQPADAAVILSLSPAQGQGGTQFTATLSDTLGGLTCDAGAISVTWDGSFLPSSPTPGDNTSATATVPTGGAGSHHTVGAQCLQSNFDGGSAPACGASPCTADFCITNSVNRCAVEPTTTTSPTTTTNPKTTSTTTTTFPRATTTTRPGATTTTTVPAATTPSTDDTGQTTTTVTIAGGEGVRLDRESSPPGGAANANGEGCDRNADVALSIDDHDVGHTVADESGRFLAPLELPSLPVGRYTLTALCGPTLTTSLDIVLVSSVDPGSSTLAVLLLFLLIGGVMLRRLIARDKLAR